MREHGSGFIQVQVNEDGFAADALIRYTGCRPPEPPRPAREMARLAMPQSPPFSAPLAALTMMALLGCYRLVDHWVPAGIWQLVGVLVSVAVVVSLESRVKSRLGERSAPNA